MRATCCEIVSPTLAILIRPDAKIHTRSPIAAVTQTWIGEVHDCILHVRVASTATPVTEHDSPLRTHLRHPTLPAVIVSHAKTLREDVLNSALRVGTCSESIRLQRWHVHTQPSVEIQHLSAPLNDRYRGSNV